MIVVVVNVDAVVQACLECNSSTLVIKCFTRILGVCERQQNLLGASVLVLQPTNEAPSTSEGIEGASYVTNRIRKKEKTRRGGSTCSRTSVMLSGLRQQLGFCDWGGWSSARV